MKSIFKKFAAALLCSLVLFVSCTDESASIKEVDNRVTTEVNSLKSQIQSLYTDLDALKGAQGDVEEQVADILERLSAIEAELPQLQDAVAELNEALAGKVSQEDFDAAVANLEQAILDAAYDDTEILAAIEDLKNNYAGIQADLEKMAAEIEELKTVLRSIVTVPQVMVDGVKAIEFNVFSYLPLADDAEVAAERVLKSSEENVAYYLFNPSSFDINLATYSVVSEEVQFKSVANPLATVVDVQPMVGAEKGKVAVVLKREKSNDNMFALAATLKDGSVIYSDYAKVVENTINAEDLVLVNKDDVALAALETIVLEENELLNLVEYVKVRNFNHKLYGLDFNFEVVEGDIKLESGVVIASNNAKGVSTIKVELVDVENNNVVLSENITVKVSVKAYYMQATATATVDATRTAFEVAAIADWAKALKDQPNTIELLKDALASLKEGNITAAVETLGGVPGFVKYTKTFTGVATAKVKIAESAAEVVDSLLPEIDKIESFADLRAFLAKYMEKYGESAYAELLEDIKISDYIPVSTISSLLSNFPLLGDFFAAGFESAVESLEGFDMLDLLNNDTVIGILETADSFASNINLPALDFAKIKAKLVEIVAGIEGDSFAGLAQSAEEAAAMSAKLNASVAAHEACVAEFNAANDQIAENFENGVWGKAKNLVNNEVVANLFEKANLTDVHDALVQVFDYALVLAQYDRTDLINIKVTCGDAVKVEGEE